MDAAVEDEVALPTCEIGLQGPRLAYDASDAVQKRLVDDPKTMAFLLVNVPDGGAELIINDMLEHALRDAIYKRLTEDGWELRNFAEQVAKVLIARSAAGVKSADNVGFMVPHASLTMKLRLS